MMQSYSPAPEAKLPQRNDKYQICTSVGLLKYAHVWTRVTHVAWLLKVHLEEMAWHVLHLLCYLAAWFDKIFERGEN